MGQIATTLGMMFCYTSCRQAIATKAEHAFVLSGTMAPVRAYLGSLLVLLGPTLFSLGPITEHDTKGLH